MPVYVNNRREDAPAEHGGDGGLGKKLLYAAIVVCVMFWVLLSLEWATLVTPSIVMQWVENKSSTNKPLTFGTYLNCTIGGNGFILEPVAPGLGRMAGVTYDLASADNCTVSRGIAQQGPPCTKDGPYVWPAEGIWQIGVSCATAWDWEDAQDGVVQNESAEQNKPGINQEQQ